MSETGAFEGKGRELGKSALLRAGRRRAVTVLNVIVGNGRAGGRLVLVAREAVEAIEIIGDAGVETGGDSLALC